MEGEIRMQACPNCGREVHPESPHAGTGCVVSARVRREAIALVDKIARDCDMVDAHAEGMHDDLPREGCPECER